MLTTCIKCYNYADNEGIDNSKKVHKVSLVNIKNMFLTGVNNVVLFDTQGVILETQQGTLMIKGQELHIGRLNLEKSETDIDGKIDGMIYSEANNEKIFQEYTYKTFWIE